jgi:hypothetical protein
MESLGSLLPSLPSLPSLPPFFFHYVLCILCALYLIVIAVLKFKYYYWYHQPLTFRFSVWRFWAARRPNTFTSTMNPLGVGDGGGAVSGAAVVYPFITNVNYENVKVYSTASISRSLPWDDIIRGIAELLNNNHKFVVNNDLSASASSTTIPYTHHERLACILSNETHGLAAFVGVYRSRLTGDVAGDIHGVCILTPRIKIERDLTIQKVSSAAPLSTSIYVCDHLAWSRYDMSDRQSLELLETTEYIQKSREIAGEQTLYRYNEIPWFVIPFTTVYTYALSLERLTTPTDGRSVRGRAVGRSIGHTAVIKVSSVNFALFYAFINEYSRDFRCSILNEITHLQHLIQSGIYQVYMLLLNKTRVLSVYIYGPSWAQASPESLDDASRSHRDTVHKKKTRGNRIERLHNYISQTSTAVVKYLPPVIPAKYDLSGKRVGISRKRTTGTDGTTDAAAADVYNPSIEIPRLLSSVRNKQNCETQVFVDGYIDSLKMRCRELGPGPGPGPGTVLIDTIAHNYIIIDEIVRAMAGDTPVIWSHKWYYVLYNAIIHRELPCKDLFMV